MKIRLQRERRSTKMAIIEDGEAKEIELFGRDMRHLEKCIKQWNDVHNRIASKSFKDTLIINFD